MTISPLGLHRVIEPPGVLPQAAWRLDASPVIAPDEVRIRVDRLNLDAASYRQIRETYSGDPDKIRRAVERRGFDRRRGVFVQAFDRPELDAALLLLPMVEFVAWDDERIVRTVAAIARRIGIGSSANRGTDESDSCSER